MEILVICFLNLFDVFPAFQISIFENYRNTNFLLGLNERRLRNMQMIDFSSMTDNIGYAGFWIT